MDKKQLPSLPTNVGKRGKQKLPDERVVHYKITDELCVPQSGMPEKIFCLQRIEFEEVERVEVRLCYYIIGKKPRMQGKWVFGQYAPFLPLEDLKVLIRAAEKKGWL